MLDAGFAHPRSPGRRPHRERARRNTWSATSQVIVDMAYAFYNADPGGAALLRVQQHGGAGRSFSRRSAAFCSHGFRSRPRTASSAIAGDTRVTVSPMRRDARRRACPPTSAFGSFCRQHFRYGRGAMRYHQARAARRRDAFARTCRSICICRGCYAARPAPWARGRARTSHVATLGVAGVQHGGLRLRAWTRARDAGPSARVMSEPITILMPCRAQAQNVSTTQSAPS